MPQLDGPAASPRPPAAPARDAGDPRRRIAAAYPGGAGIYARLRYLIIRPNILAPMDALLPARGRILEVGCGYGLFAGYFAARGERREVLGVDRDERRIALASRMAEALGLPARFAVSDVRQLPAAERFDAAYALDVLHHVPAEHHLGVLRDVRERLAPGGTFLVKEIATTPRLGLAFTWALDRVMAPQDQLSYRSPDEWLALLAEAGFRARAQRIPDVLPYPHVLIECVRD
jgi:2-polyprenyl-3-methyl-5-hydroxy-6-metoxy-1,4-benzoquinol methylase